MASEAVLAVLVILIILVVLLVLLVLIVLIVLVILAVLVVLAVLIILVICFHGCSPCIIGITTKVCAASVLFMHQVKLIAKANLHQEFVKHGKEIPNRHKRKKEANKPTPGILQQKVSIKKISQSCQ